jgi:hypothetical protein
MQTDQIRQCFDDNSILGTKNKLLMLNIETQTKRNINLERERERDKKGRVLFTFDAWNFIKE